VLKIGAKLMIFFGFLKFFPTGWFKKDSVTAENEIHKKASISEAWIYLKIKVLVLP